MPDGTPPQPTAEQIAAEFAKPLPAAVRVVDSTKTGVERADKVVNASGCVELNYGNGPNINITGEMSVKDKLKIWSMLDEGYLGDPKERNDMKKFLSETHAYGFTGLPVYPAAEFDWLSHLGDTYRLGIAAKPIKLGRVNLSADFYPFSGKAGDGLDGDEKMLWVKGGINFGKGMKGYGVMKKFWKKDKPDVAFGKVGISQKIGKKYYIKAEYRDFPMKCGKRSRGFYAGAGLKHSF